MKFSYQPIVITAPDADDYLLILRPDIAITVHGPRDSLEVIGLVDTGADFTILPKSVGEALGLSLRPSGGNDAVAFGGNRLRLSVGEVVFEIRDDAETVRWHAEVYFYDFPRDEAESAILGRAGFLDYFTATFDGLEGLLTLAPSIELPAC